MVRNFVLMASCAALLAVAGCTPAGKSVTAGDGAVNEVPAPVVAGTERGSPVMFRIFKEEGVLEVWKEGKDGRYGLAASYDICRWSGKLGPKYVEGDRQAPEGFYSVTPGQMNPNSSYHLSFNIGFPNAFDRANGRTGTHLMVHGGCSSAGCYSMTDPQIEEIYRFARDSFRGGQKSIQVQAFPFRMTDANMARYRDDPNMPFWKVLKEGYDAFEAARKPLAVAVCERRYVFGLPASVRLDPSGPCPEGVSAQENAYAGSAASRSLLASVISTGAPRSPSIRGFEEAALVSDWSARRARGERVSREPPSLDGATVEEVEAAVKRARAAVRSAQASRAALARPVSVPDMSARRRF